jgi:hypothetical protein
MVDQTHQIQHELLHIRPLRASWQVEADGSEPAFGRRAVCLREDERYDVHPREPPAPRPVVLGPSSSAGERIIDEPESGGRESNFKQLGERARRASGRASGLNM